MDNNRTLQLFLKISQHRMRSHYLPKLIHSLNLLDSTMLWHREMAHLNSIGGIALHICEHVRRISVRLSTQNHDGFSTGIEDYFPDLNLSPEELVQTVTETFDQYNSVMEKVIANRTDEIDMHSIYHLVEHTGYHLGQIVDRSQRISGKSLKFCQNGINERSLRALIEENL